MKKLSFILAVLMMAAIALSSCHSRQPHCPGVYSKTAPVVKVKHV